tara:strand:- start:22164 stop:23765 length:1602 start_codon:yes stop_codon:yes gene_type:complete
MPMGRGSDTRMYSPRSESDKMYSSANEDETKYSPTDPEYNEQKREEKKRKAEEKKSKRAKVKHIKIRASQGLSGEESPSPLDDGNKRDAEREIGLAGGPAGSRGTLLDLATGAKSGTGSAMSPGLPIAMSEPMEDAWSSLLKQDPHVHDVGDGSDEDTQRYFDEEVRPEVMNPDTPRPYATMDNGVLETQIQRMLEGILEYDEDILNEYNYRMVENDLNAQGSAVSDAGFDPTFQDVRRSEPMKDAWSSLLKRETPRSIAGRRRREARQQFRPSTGQFKTPPGGMSGGAGATMRRFKAQMRGIKSGKKTGLMKPHLSVEMSHRGIQTKQPLSKDPQKYTQYKGQSEARKILGNVRTPFSPHARYGARSNYAGPTGAGRLGGLMAGQSGQMARPALRRMRRPRMPRMPRMRAPMPPSPPMMPQAQSSVPAMPSPSSSIMMSEERYRSEILKARNSLHRIELLNLMRRLIQAKEREAKIKKNLTATDAADLPGHPAGVKPTDDEDPQGPTENLETDAKTFGLDPVGIINSRRGHM